MPPTLHKSATKIQALQTGRAWLRAQGLEAHLARATHLAWTTGGLFVPEAEYHQFLQRGRAQPQAASA